MDRSISHSLERLPEDVHRHWATVAWPASLCPRVILAFEVELRHGKLFVVFKFFYHDFRCWARRHPPADPPALANSMQYKNKTHVKLLDSH
ncbi:hypothetical protein EVAR_32914_1 [Eumeta japonica]|uniref:Uncharacterized protein n=1 Tax=Eumeta variegata TaxID=151549 RepID=A0A4C2A3K6_EUMVA|nr:hypothetical protein EVAR_32914_1 [Eumeta japonica]